MKWKLFDSAEPDAPEQISLQDWGPGHRGKRMDEVHIKRREETWSRTRKGLSWSEEGGLSLAI